MTFAAFSALRLWLANLPSGIKWAAGTILAIILLCAGYAIWLSHHDKAVIAAHDAMIDEQVMEKADEATQAANAADSDRRAVISSEQAETKKAMTDAETKNPTAAAAPSGPVTNAVASKLRGRASKDSHTSH